MNIGLILSALILAVAVALIVRRSAANNARQLPPPDAHDLRFGRRGCGSADADVTD